MGGFVGNCECVGTKGVSLLGGFGAGMKDQKESGPLGVRQGSAGLGANCYVLVARRMRGTVGWLSGSTGRSA